MKAAPVLLLSLLCWTVSIEPLRVIDGDTFTARVPIWIGLDATETIRVLGVNTPERKGETLQAAELARGFTDQWLRSADGPILVRACRRDSFGRVLGRVTRQRVTADGTLDNLAEALIKAGHGQAMRER